MPDPEATGVTVVVVTFESARVLPACRDALRASGIPVLVIDHASRERSAEIAREFGAEVLAQPANIGYGRANSFANVR